MEDFAWIEFWRMDFSEHNVNDSNSSPCCGIFMAKTWIA